jgi:AcrR family transcriptional regulator
VSEEAALDQQTINICLTEVDRCRDTSPRPNFIVLLGDRYGWRPPPPQIEAEEFEAILRHVSEEEKTELVAAKSEDPGWYLRDENADPPEYVLKEREGEYRESENWGPVEQRLASALRKGAAASGVGGEELMKYVASATEQEIERGALRVDDAPEHVFCFFREIANLDDLKSAIPEVRPEWDPADPERVLAEDFVDLRNPETDREMDSGASGKLEDLKERLRARLPGNIHPYTSRWTGEEITTDHVGIGKLPSTVDECLRLNIVEAGRRLLAARPEASMDEIASAAELDPRAVDRHFASRDQLVAAIGAEAQPQNLCVDVWLRLSRVILSELKQLAKEGVLDKEIAAHRNFGEERARNFVPRFFTTGEDALQRIARYIGETGPDPLAVAGVSGSGKSALIAKAAMEAEGAHPEAALIRRFIGATPESSDGRSLLASLCQEIARKYGEDESAPADYRELVEEFPKRLALAAESGRPLVVFLDALDQLSDAEGARSLVWLPAVLPDNVRVVVSALRADPESKEPAPKGSECHTTLKARLPADKVVELRPMTRKEGEKLLDLWLEDASRALRDPGGRQRHEVISKFAAEGAEPERKEAQGLPLYLKLAFEEARRWRSFTAADKTTLASGISGIIRDNLFARLSRDENHGEVMVSYSLGYLGAAKNGLSEDELLDVLSAQKAVLDDFQDRSPKSPKVDRLPVVVWSRLYFDLEPYLGELSADEASLMSFYHRQLREVVEKDYLVEDEQRLAALEKEGEDRELHDGRARHRELADYFASEERQPLERPSDGEVKVNLRRLSELPYQQTHGEMWDDVYKTLTDFHFLEVKAANAGVVESTDAQGNVTRTYTGPYLLQEDYALALERMPGNGAGGTGDRRTIIVTATDFGDGYVVRCPHCNVVHTFNENQECAACQEQHDLAAWVGAESMTCPTKSCKGRLRVNDFTVPPRQ